MALWAAELSEFDIQYRPQTAIKGQVVADVITEFTLGDGQGGRRDATVEYLYGQIIQ